jgi:hypothetical protein
MSFSATPVAHATVKGSNGGTTAGVNTTGADLLVAVISYYNGAGASPVPTDSNANTWTQIGTTQAGSNTSVKMFYVASPTVGTGHTFSSTSSGASSFSSMEIGAWSGSAASPLDQTSQAAVLRFLTATPTSAAPMNLARWPIWSKPQRPRKTRPGPRAVMRVAPPRSSRPSRRRLPPQPGRPMTPGPYGCRF